MEFFSYLKPFLGWMESHTTIGLCLVFFISLFESLAFVGLLIPGSLMMTAAGILIGVDILPLWPTLLAAILGAIVGDGLSYRLGYHFKDSIRTIWPFRRYPKFLIKGERFFIAHGGKSVFLARFSPVRPIVPVIAGMLRMNSWRFLFSNVTSAVLWAPAYIVPGILVGLAALQFAPEVATQFVLLVLCVLVILCLTAWLIKILFFKILDGMRYCMDKLWEAIKHTPKINPLYRLLQDPEKQEGHHQLNLLVSIVIAGIMLLILTYMVVQHTGLYDWNVPINQLLRNLYAPKLEKIMIVITYMGDRIVLGATLSVVLLYLASRKQWYTVCHWVAVIVLSYGIVVVSKALFHSPRPGGLIEIDVSNSYPSGHTTLAMALYAFYAIVLERFLPQYRRLIYSSVATVIAFIAFSRLYLGAHWFTDIVGGLLAGWISAMSVTISFRCKAAPKFSLKLLNIVLACSFVVFMGIQIKLFFPKDSLAYVPVWPKHAMAEKQWWRQNNTEVLIYRKDRLGRVRDLINVQWVDDLSHIIARLQKNDWVLLPNSPWINAINHLANSNDNNRLTLFPLLYQGKAPAAVFIHTLQNHKTTVVVLRLWAANVEMGNETKPLWYGTVTYEKITPRYPLKYGGVAVSLNDMPSPTVYLTNEMDGFVIRRLSLKSSLPPDSISAQQWQGGVLLIRAR